MTSDSVLRIRILLIFFCLWAVVLGFKLYTIQIVRGEEYAALLDRQYALAAAPVFDRGSIFFESKAGSRVSAATMKEGYNLVMNPMLLQNPAQVYEALSHYVTLDRDTFLAKAAKPADQHEELAKRLDPAIGISIGELNIPGIKVFKENWRVYPGGSLAAHTIGLIGYDSSNQLGGRYGLERYYEEILSRNEKGRNVNFFAELFGDIRGNVTGITKNGDIVTTIDPAIEGELEKVLQQTQAAWGSDSIGGIIMDPKTGQIFAMAARPTFDLNNLKEVEDPRVFSNPLVENVYEMGSIMKPLTMAAGIDSGAVTAETTYNDTGFLLLNGKRFSNYDGKARGVISMQEVLSQSLNVGAATIALKVGLEDFTRYFLSFGLGETTGIDQPNEQKGIVENLKSGREIEQATASYGQGIAFSPIATVRALSILANGGVLVRPHLVKEVIYTDGTKTAISPKQGPRVIRKETAEEVTRMLVKVVDTALRKGAVKMDRYSIAAKTGTAQIADRENGGYYTDRYLHSFFGYFPAYNPRYIIFLYHVYPKGAQFASETLTDPFIELATFLINYNELPPDR